MKKQIHTVYTIVMILLLSTANAATVATGSVMWNLNVTPDTVRYLYGQDYFGRVDNVNAYFDGDFSTSLQVGASSIYATWDPATGNATDYGLTVVGGPTTSRANVNYAIGFTVTTDVISFSYDYDFLGHRDGTGNEDSLSMGVQVEISDGNQIYYTDYSGSHPTFRTNWAYFELDGSQTVLDETGTISFQYGDPGIVRTWFISTDVLASGSDSVGLVPLPASLPLLLAGLAVISGLGRRKQ